jgi:hypothetical protein
MTFFSFFHEPTVASQILTLWQARPADQRTFMALHEFESQMWHNGLRLDHHSLQHRLAVFTLTKGMVTPE